MPVEAAFGVVHAESPLSPRRRSNAPGNDNHVTCRRARARSSHCRRPSGRRSGAGRSPRSSPRWRWPRSTPRSPTSRCPPLPPICTSAPRASVWVVNVYQIALVATLLPLGALGEIVGHQRIYLGGLMLFTIASLFCALRLVAGQPAGRAHAAGPGRQRHHERQHGAGALRLSAAGCSAAASATTRWWSATAFTVGPIDRLRHPRGRPVAVAVRRQHSVRPRRDRHRLCRCCRRRRAPITASIFSARRSRRRASACSSLGIGSAAHNLSPRVVVVELVDGARARLHR